MSASRILFVVCISFVIGIGFGSFFQSSPVSPWTGWAAVVIGSALIMIFRKHKKLAFVGIFLIASFTGILRYDMVETKANENELAQYNDQEETISFIARITEDPDERIKNTQITVRPDEVADGKILITLDSFSDYRYGDTIRLTGQLQAPVVFDDFNYGEFLAKDGIYSVMYHPMVELVERGRHESMGAKLMAQILGVKQKFRNVLAAHIASPESGILGAILLGDKGNLSDQTKKSLNAAGVRHITAISGMHVAILTATLMSLLLGLGLWRKQAFYITIVLMLLFIVLTGFQPSAVRAGIMGGLLLLGQHLGRINVSLRALSYAAAIMLFLNPFLLTRDVGFQLSFLAVLGIIYFSPIIASFLVRVPDTLHLREIMSMTIAAQVLTLPILIANFGFISLVSILGNVLILPLLPVIVGAGFLFFIGGSLWEPLGLVLSLPVSLLLTYIMTVVDVLAGLPFASMRIEHISMFWLLMFYIPVAVFYWKFRRRGEFLGSSA